MKKKIIAPIAGLSLLFFAFGVTQIKQSPKQAEASSGTYWSSWVSSNLQTIETGGTAFVSVLKSKITQVSDGQANTVSYNGLWDAYKTSDAVPGSNGSKIWDVYGGYQYSYQTSGKGSYATEGAGYNREHSVPKSWFSENTPAYSDLVHLLPTDGKVNGMRSNHAFGEVENASYSHKIEARSYNGVQYQTAGYSKLGSPKAINGVTPSTSIVFEPDDQYKGDFARIYMYFAVRYGGGSCGAVSGAGATIFTSTCTNSNPYMTNYGLALMRKWHVQDPVSQKEITRNNAIESIQHNRNPFVDYPEWADKIFGTNYAEIYGDGGEVDTTPKVLSISVSPTTLNLDLNGTKTKQLEETVNVANNASQAVTWTSRDPDIASVSSSGLVTAQSEGDTVITVKSTFDTSKTATCNVHVADTTDSQTPVTSVTVSPDELELYLDSTLTSQLEVSVAPADASQAVNWISDNEDVATVSSTGLVTAVGVGRTYITAISAANANKTGACEVVVLATGGVDDDDDEGEPSGGDDQGQEVEEVALTTILVTPPTKTKYQLNEQLDLTGMSVKAIYSDASEKDVTAEVTLSRFDSSTIGRKLIEVYYTEDGVTVNDSFVVKVLEQEPTIEPKPEGGCFGSIVASSVIISATSLLGVGLILIKKRRKFE